MVSTMFFRQNQPKQIFFLVWQFRPLPNKNVQIWDHIFPLLFFKASESPKILDSIWPVHLLFSLASCLLSLVSSLLSRRPGILSYTDFEFIARQFFQAVPLALANSVLKIWVTFWATGLKRGAAISKKLNHQTSSVFSASCPFSMLFFFF